jgi:hypothetical protein
MENLELLLAFLVFRGRLELASRVEELMDLIQDRNYHRILIESKRLGFTKEEIMKF